MLSAHGRPRLHRASVPTAAVVLALGWLAGCSLRDDDEAAVREQSGAGSVSVAGVELYPLPARVVDECRAAQEDARIPVLCPARLPRPSRSLAGDSALPPSSVMLRPWGKTGIDISYSAEAGRPRLDQPDRFIHLQVIEQDERILPAARPAALGGKFGVLAPATSRGYASEAYFANHVRFFWTEDGVRYAATLHNFGPGTRRLLGWLIAHLRPAGELRRPSGSADPSRVRMIDVQVGEPTSLAAGKGRVWVTGQGEAPVSGSWLVGIDSRTGSLRGRIRTAGGGVAATVGVGESVWVAHRGVRGAPGLLRANPEREELAEPVALTAELVAVASTSLAVWALDSGGWPADAGYLGGSVVRVDPAAGSVAARIPVGRAPSDIAIGAGHLWVTNNLDGTVSQVHMRSDRAVGAIRVGREPTGVAVGYGAVWVANHRDGTVSRIDPTEGTVVRTIRVGRAPRGVAVGEGSVWVTNELDDTVSRIDPHGNRVTESIPVGAGPVDVAVAEGAVWVANLHDATVSRIEP